MQTIVQTQREKVGDPTKRNFALIARPRILIGPLSNDPTESVSCVNAAFVKGLHEQYDFLPLDATRRFGNTRQTTLNGINLFYF
ncbi:MAG TPA: hypothetical protein VGF13_19295, partial [Verrucomicrobiae bacterium]